MIVELLIVVVVFFSTLGLCSAQSTSSDDEDEDQFPIHEFVVKKTQYQTGKKAGQFRWMVTLNAAPYSYYRHRDTQGTDHGTVHFSCKFCAQIGVANTKAYAFKTTTDGQPRFKLTGLPSDHDHACSPSPTAILCKQFNSRLYDEVGKDPLKPPLRIYEEVLLEFLSKLSEDGQASFLQEVSSFRNIQAGLYKHRRKFIPRQPESFEDFDTESDWFLLSPNTSESIIKFDAYTSNKGRIVALATK